LACGFGSAFGSDFGFGVGLACCSWYAALAMERLVLATSAAAWAVSWPSPERWPSGRATTNAGYSKRT
jgi:hypothetical protein